MYCITLKDQVELTITSSSMKCFWDCWSVLLYFAANYACLCYVSFSCCSATGNSQWSVVICKKQMVTVILILMFKKNLLWFQKHGIFYFFFLLFTTSDCEYLALANPLIGRKYMELLESCSVNTPLPPRIL